VRDKIVTTYAPALSKTEDVNELAMKGEELARVIFKGDEGDAARTALEAFIAQRPAGDIPSLFVRFAGQHSADPVVFPIGMLALRNVADGTGFLGRHARVVMPLPLQAYEVPESCEQENLTVLPDEANQDKALRAAREAMGGEVSERWWSAAAADHR